MLPRIMVTSTEQDVEITEMIGQVPLGIELGIGDYTRPNIKMFLFQDQGVREPTGKVVY